MEWRKTLRNRRVFAGLCIFVFDEALEGRQIQ